MFVFRLLVFVVLTFPLSVYSANRTESEDAFLQIIDNLNDRIYVLNEMGADKEKYISEMNDSKRELSALIMRPDFVSWSSSEFEPTMLGIVSLFGYYPLVELLVNDKVMINELEKEGFKGLTPLEISRSRLYEYFIFVYPEKVCSPFDYVPRVLALHYFYRNSGLDPYAQTTKILMDKGAKSKLSIHEIYVKLIHQRIKSIKSHKGNTEQPKAVKAIIGQLENNIKLLNTLNNTNEQDYFKEMTKVMNSIINDSPKESSFEYLNTESLEKVCNTLEF